MKLIDFTGEMELDNDATASIDDMNSIAGAMLTELGFERWHTESEIEMGDDCETVVAKIREWANKEELLEGGIVGA